MVFTSAVFLFAFLPVALIAFYLFPASWRPLPLLVLSCLFYGWGEPVLVVLIMVSVLVNLVWGRWLARSVQDRRRRLLLSGGIVLNLLPLLVFKYLEFALANVGLTDLAARTELPLPIGVSFYTFMAISYLMDIYRSRDQEVPTLLTFGAFLTMFPHLVAGPIVRWSQIGHQLKRPSFDAGLFGYGALRISVGLTKKVVLADSLSPVVDSIFELGPPPSVGAAWLGAGLYALQIYFDFSGYSDIAIGLAAMLGIRFEENFNYPYRSRSAREFWQRWHISLGSWFRDYVYFPLGGSRVRAVLVWRNLLVVWALTGLWHGAAWTFVLWGMYFGVLIGLERAGLGRLVERLPRIGQHLYGLVVVVLGWVLFRSVDVAQAVSYYRAMAGTAGLPWWDAHAQFAFSQTLVVAAIGLVLAAGVAQRLMDAAELRLAGARATDVTHRKVVADPSAVAPIGTDPVPQADHSPSRLAADLLVALCVAVLMIVSTAFVVSVSYSPFIYFRF